MIPQDISFPGFDPLAAKSHGSAINDSFLENTMLTTELAPTTDQLTIFDEDGTETEHPTEWIGRDHGTAQLKTLQQPEGTDWVKI